MEREFESHKRAEREREGGNVCSVFLSPGGSNQRKEMTRWRLHTSNVSHTPPLGGIGSWGFWDKESQGGLTQVVANKYRLKIAVYKQWG